MIQIDGVFRLIPIKISADAGNIKIDEQSEESAIIQTLFTANGVCQVVYPAGAIDGVIDVLQKAKKEASENSKHVDLYVPKGGMQEVDALAKAENEIRNSDK